MRTVLIELVCDGFCTNKEEGYLLYQLELLVKEALHIQMTPSEECFNQDGGLEVPDCWTAVMRRQGGMSYPHAPTIDLQ